LSSVALAQLDPEQGDTGQWQPPPAEQQQPQGQQPQQQPQQQQRQQEQQQQRRQRQRRQPPQQQGQGRGQWLQQDQEQPPALQGDGDSESAQDEPSDTDHGAVVGALGVGFFGVETIQMDPGVQAMAEGLQVRTSGDTKMRAPTIGTRYWFSETVGLDAAIGLSFRSQDVEVDQGDGLTLVGGQDGFVAFGLHLGLPLALETWSHFTLLAIPEVDVGYAKGTVLGQDGEGRQDVDLSGLEFRAGARVGGSIQFGFWDLPQLALQATIGLGFEFRKQTAEPLAGNLIERSTTDTRFATSVEDIFNGTIRAVYYFN
jgi:hypothetical protein